MVCASLYELLGENACWIRQIGDSLRHHPEGYDVDSAPIVERDGHDFAGWLCPDGRKKDNTKVLDDLVLGNAFYVAQWTPNRHIVTFKGNGGFPDTMTREYDHG